MRIFILTLLVLKIAEKCSKSEDQHGMELELQSLKTPQPKSLYMSASLSVCDNMCSKTTSLRHEIFQADKIHTICHQ